MERHLSLQRTLGWAPTSVVSCKIPWKENSLISRGIGDFSIHPARTPLFSGKPGYSFNQPVFFIRSARFDQSSGQPRVSPGKQGGGGSRKKRKIGEFSFRGILQPTTRFVRCPHRVRPFESRIGPKWGFGLTPGELLTIINLTFTLNLRNPQRGNSSRN